MIQCFDLRGIRKASYEVARYVGGKLLEAVLRDGTVFLYVPELVEPTRRFRALMEQVYLLPSEIKSTLEKPEYNFQVGLTGSQREKPLSVGGSQAGKAKADPKQRFFYPDYGFPPEFSTPYLGYLYFDKVIPEIDGWNRAAEDWCEGMRQAMEEFDWALASGLGLSPETFCLFCQNGPHLVASTFVDLTEVCEPGAVIAGVHHDLNFASGHAAGALPGLYGETPDGRWIAVDPPEKCIAVQPAWQLWYMTGGFIPRVRHMVIFDERNRKIVNQAKCAGVGCYRTQMQYFQHAWTEAALHVLPKFTSTETEKRFPSQWVGEFVLDRLEEIGLLTSRPQKRPFPPS